MVALPDKLALERSEWKHHPNYPSHVLLLGSHQNFRRISRALVEQTTAESITWSRHLYQRWIAAMRSHEAYEERKLYPFLERRWGVSMAEATRGHDDLHRADDDVHAAFEADDWEAAARALEAHDRVLDRHLEIEEELVIPLLLALTPREFHDYYHSVPG